GDGKHAADRQTDADEEPTDDRCGHRRAWHLLAEILRIASGEHPEQYEQAVADAREAAAAVQQPVFRRPGAQGQKAEQGEGSPRAEVSLDGRAEDPEE